MTCPVYATVQAYTGQANFYWYQKHTVMYSVTQSYANSEDNINEDNILDQIYKKQICPDFYYNDFWFS